MSKKLQPNPARSLSRKNLPRFRRKVPPDHPSDFSPGWRRRHRPRRRKRPLRW